MTDAESILIRSGVDPETGAGLCFLTWGKLRVKLDPQLVLNTARDLHAAAARAESDIALFRVLSAVPIDTHIVAGVVRDVRNERGMLPGKSALRIEAIAGLHTGLPYVHAARGSQKHRMSPDEARAMALAWTETAVAAYSDSRLRYVLGEYPQLSPADVDGIFTGLLRAGGDHTTERHT